MKSLLETPLDLCLSYLSCVLTSEPCTLFETPTLEEDMPFALSLFFWARDTAATQHEGRGAPEEERKRQERKGRAGDKKKRQREREAEVQNETSSEKKMKNFASVEHGQAKFFQR